jgi:ribonuclease HI
MEHVNKVNILQWNCRGILRKKCRLQNFLSLYDVQVFALSETHLSPGIEFSLAGYNVLRYDRPDGYGGVMLGVKNGLSYKQTMCGQISHCEMVAAKIIDQSGCGMDVVSVYVAPNCRLNTVEVGNALANISSSHPMLLVGDYNAHSQSWGCHDDDTRAGTLIDMFDDLDLVVLNDGSITRMASPPRRSSAIDLTLCSSSLALDVIWRVIDDLAGSDHFPILSSINPSQFPKKSTYQPTNIPKNISWARFRGLMSEGVDLISDQVELEEKYEIFTETIKNALSSATPRNTLRTNSSNYEHPPWWDFECDNLECERVASFKKFRRNGNSNNYNDYTNTEDRMTALCNKKSEDAWRTFCSSLSAHTHLSTVWKMAKRFRGADKRIQSGSDPNDWISDFADKIAPPFVPTHFLVPECSERFIWLEEPFSFNDLNAALQSCKNTAAGLDGIKFQVLKNLPENALQFLLEIYNQILTNGTFPVCWRETKIVPILKPGKNPNQANSYRPISLLSCMRKLMEKMLCTRLDYWAERFDVHSPTQFGFRKGRGTRDCLARLSNDIQISFEKKEWTLATFLDISGAYDNVLIPELCLNLCGLQLPFKIVRLLYNLLQQKKLYFYINDKVWAQRIGFKGLPQGSVLSPLLYNINGADIDLVLTPGVSILQYADDIVLYKSGRILQEMQESLQSSLDAIEVFYSDLGLNISSDKSEIVLFSKRLPKIKFKLYINELPLQVSDEFKYLGVIFDKGLTWNSHTRYVVQKCKSRINFMKSISSTSWGCHPANMLLLFKTLVRSVIEYGCICFSEMAATHFKKLERVQWRGLRICLGLMRSTHTGTVEVLSGVPSLDLRFSFLNYKYLINAFSNEYHLIKTQLATLSNLNSQKITKIYDTVKNLEIQNAESYTQFDLKSLLNIPRIEKHNFEILKSTPAEFHSTIAPRQFLSAISRFENFTKIYTDGSKSQDGTSFGVYVQGRMESGYRLREPSGVFTSELAAILSALNFINENNGGNFLIITDSLSSIEAIQSQKISFKTHTLVMHCKELLWRLLEQNNRIVLMWVPSHVGIEGNEIVDRIAREASRNVELWNMKTYRNDLFPLAKNHMLKEWQKRWNIDKMGRFSFSILPNISLSPWFRDITDEDRNYIVTLSRILTNHTRTRNHLNRIQIVDDPICVCSENYETVDHILWQCSRFASEREQLKTSLESQEDSFATPIRDLLGQRKFDVLRDCMQFIKEIDFHF